MNTEQAPIAIWDVRVKDPSWFDHPRRADRIQWLRDNDLPADSLYRVEFYQGDTLFARIFCYHRNELGNRHWNANHENQIPGQPHDHSTCAVAEEPPRDVTLRRLPGDELLTGAPER